MGKEYININPEERKIESESRMLLGILGDANTDRIYFKCQKIVGDDIDLSKLQIYVKYAVSDRRGEKFASETQIYHCEDVKDCGDYITFSWRMSGNVFSESGFVAYSILAASGKTVKWNTYPAIGTVGMTVPGGLEEIAEEYQDVITQLLERMDHLEKGGNTGGGNEGAAELINSHDTSELAHNDIRLLIKNLTTSKVSTSDIADNLTTDTPNSVLSAAQGVVIAKSISDLKKSIEDQPGGEVIEVDAELKEYMNEVKPRIKQAIINKGGSVENEDSFGDYAARIEEIPNGVYAAEDLPPQSTLIARYDSTNPVGVTLNFTDVGADGYLIIKKNGSKPESSADGNIVYNGVYQENVLDKDVETGNVYYYRVYPRNSRNQYQSIEAQSIAVCDYKSREAQIQAKELKLDDQVALGYYNQVFVWDVVDTQDAAGPMMAAQQNCGNRAWDEKEADSENPNPITARKNSGNNRWAFSNVRQWLNSAAGKNEWFEKQHEYDVAPQGYKAEAGFLNGFTEAEIEAIVTRTNTCVLDANDGGGTETVEDLIWLASTYELGKEVTVEGYKFEKYNGTSATTAYQSNWWTRTINDVLGNANSACYVRYVIAGGSLGGSAANPSHFAVRPFCQLRGDAWLIWSENLGAYILADDSQRAWGI